MGEKRPITETTEAFRDDEPKKLFVGGLSRATTADSMRDYFSRWGIVSDVIVMMDPQGISRGFGFVTFELSSAVDRIVEQPAHFIDSKQVDIKRSLAKHLRPPAKQLNLAKKVFLGGLPTDMTEDDLKEQLSVYGKVSEANIMYDEKTMKSRGFGFVGFDDDSILDKLLKQQFIPIRNRQVEVKAARQRINVPMHMSVGPPRPATNGAAQAPSAGGPPYDYGYGYGSPYGAYPPQPYGMPPAANPYGGYPPQGYGYGAPPAGYGGYPAPGGYPPPAGYGAPYGAPHPGQPAAYGAAAYPAAAVHPQYQPAPTEEPATKRQKHSGPVPGAVNGEPAAAPATGYGAAPQYAPATYGAPTAAYGQAAGSTTPAASHYAGYSYSAYPDPSKANGNAPVAQAAPPAYYPHPYPA